MARYEIRHACGHGTYTEQLVGKTADRERRVGWLEKNKVCPACFAARKKAEGAALANQNASAGLPALTGSPKQVAWAEQIRADAVKRAADVKPYEPISADRAASNAAKAGLDVQAYLDGREKVASALEAARATLLGQTEAKWWIDNRDSQTVSLFTTRERLVNEVFADAIARDKAARAAKADAEATAKAQARAAEDAARAAAREAAEAEYLKLTSFRVGDRAGSVVVAGDAITVHSRDGRTATGWIMDGQWAICACDNKEFSSLHPEAERIARDARAAWSAAQQ